MPPSRSSVQILLLFCLLFPLSLRAEVTPVAIRVPEPTAWTGQRLPVFVDLRARGSFAGAAAFSLPEIPRTIILKVGNPIVSSQQIEGESWFVQTHEFALFSQQTGALEIPAFAVRFGSREGFTGPATEQQVTTPATSAEIRRPPGTEAVGFLVTTESFDLTETWDPAPGPVEAGAVFKRTIAQRADQVSGMALAAAPTVAPDGIRVYSGQPEVTDKTERGAFLGERRETLTYLLQQPGVLEIPSLTYLWWNPKSEELQSRTLPAVTIEVAPASAATSTAATSARRFRPWLLAAAFLGLGAWRRRSIAHALQGCWKMLNPPERAAARSLLHACRRSNPAEAEAAWIRWRNLQPPGFQAGSELRSTVLGMQRHLFGPATSETWQGRDLARALVAQRSADRRVRPPSRSSCLPQLNSRWP